MELIPPLSNRRSDSAIPGVHHGNAGNESPGNRGGGREPQPFLYPTQCLLVVKLVNPYFKFSTQLKVIWHPGAPAGFFCYLENLRSHVQKPPTLAVPPYCGFCSHGLFLLNLYAIFRKACQDTLFSLAFTNDGLSDILHRFGSCSVES